MLTAEEMVKQFHSKYGHQISKLPTLEIPDIVKQLRVKLIEEEYDELGQAIYSQNLTEIADALADLVYVLVGTAISYGIPFDRVFAEVHNSNMTKTPSKAYEGQKYGAVNPKGPDYMAPQIESILHKPEVPTDLELETIHDRT